MFVETKAVIDGKPCTKVFSKNEITVYSVDSDDTSKDVLFFAKGDKVLFSQEITADCGQNTGFISGIDFKGFN